MTDTIKVLIVDDHAMVQVGLTTILESFSDMQLVGAAANAKEALDLCDRLRPDVVLMDVMMPGMDGVEATRLLRQSFPAIQVVILTSFENPELVNSVLHAGAMGYLMKNVSAHELASAIRAAHSGRHTLAPEAAKALIDASTKPPSIGHDLTEREIEVLTHMVKGLSNAEIAIQMNISRFTVKNHISSIFSKLGAASRTEAATLALQHHLVHLD